MRISPMRLRSGRKPVPVHYLSDLFGEFGLLEWVVYLV